MIFVLYNIRLILLINQRDGIFCYTSLQTCGNDVVRTKNDVPEKKKKKKKTVQKTKLVEM